MDDDRYPNPLTNYLADGRGGDYGLARSAAAAGAGAALSPPVETEVVPRDLDRILALKQREPVDCEREPGVRRWPAATQALVEVVTAQYSLGRRLTCGCRDRYITALPGGRLLVFQQGREGAPPPAPVEVALDDFLRDVAQVGEVKSADYDAFKIASRLRPGQSATVKGLGHQFCITELMPIQAWGLREIPRAQGAFGMVSVGGGKSLLGIMAPLTMPHLKTWVIFAKPDQRLHYKFNYLRAREHFRVPAIIFDQQKDFDGSFIVDGVPTLHFIPYSTLSNPKNTLLLDSIDPDGVLADEMHLLANKGSSRTMRWSRIMTKRERVFAGWSGSTIKRTLKDVSHLAAFALGLGSPYPILPDSVEAMASVIDPVTIPDRTSKMAEELFSAFGNKAIKPEIFKAGFAGDAGVREGHRDRVVRTPGVISTRSSNITCSILIRERKAPPVSPAVLDNLREARLGIRPDGMPLVETLEIVTCAREVAAGFYGYWAFPKATAEDRAEGGLIDQWKAARKVWNKELRVKIMRGEPHLDSASLCENAAERAWREPRYTGDLPVWPAESWPAWAAIKDKVEPDPRTKWIDDYLARDAAAWALEHRGIVWVQSRAFGKKVAEISGLPYHAGGPGAEAAIMAETGKRSIVVSMKAHGEGRDGLQEKFCEQLFAEFPPSGDRVEQILGRLARPGQDADTIETWVYRHVPEYRDAFRSAYKLAEFIEATTPNRQLLLAADISFEV